MTLLSHSKTCNVGCWCSYTIILGMTGFEITCLLYVPTHLSSTKMIHKTVSKLCSYDRCRSDHCSTSLYIFLRKHVHLVIHAEHRNLKHAPHRNDTYTNESKTKTSDCILYRLTSVGCGSRIHRKRRGVVEGK